MANLGVETAGTTPVQQLSINSGAGVSMGFSTSDLISFYNATPVAQQANTVDAIVQLVNLGLLPSGSVLQTSRPKPTVLTAATTTTPANNAGRVNILNSAAGFNTAMSAATGSGNVYDFFVGTTVTTGSMTITSNGTDLINGAALQVSGASTACFFTGASNTTITFNGSTKGGFIGDQVRMVDVSTAVWQINVVTKVTGVAATPFS